MRRLGIFISVLCIVASPSQTKAQQTDHCHLRISGRVTDAENQLPVAYVILQVRNTGHMVSSDSLGYYQLDHLCPGKITITCNRIGFKPQEIEVEMIHDEVVDFRITFDPAVFRTVEVSGEKLRRESAHVSTSLSGRELDQLRGLSLGEGLKNLAGVNALNTGSGISKPVIHGLHSNRILILNNGIRQEGQQWGSEHAPEIDPFIASKLTVVKGANTVRYGPDAIGGVVLVEPREMRQNAGTDGAIFLAGFTNGRQGAASAYIDFVPAKLKGFSARLQGTVKRSGNVQSANYYLKNSGLREYNYSYALSYNRKRFGVDVYYSQFNTDVGIFSGSHIGNLSDLQRAFDSNVPLDSAGFSYEIDRPFQHIVHELVKVKAFVKTGKSSRLNLTYARQYNLRNEYDKHRPLNDSLAALNHPELHLELTTHTADLDWELAGNKKFRTQVGISSIRQGNTYDGRFFIPNFINEGAGVFVIEKWKRKNLELEAGARYDFRHLEIFRYEEQQLVSPDHYYRNLSGSLGLNYHFSDRLTVIANVGSAWRPPQASELYSNGLHHGAAAVEIGDETLLEENALNIQASVKYETSRVALELSPYINYIHHFIYLVPDIMPTLTIRGAFPTFHYTQVEATFKGLDFSGNIRVNDHVHVNSRMSLLRAKNKSTGDFLILMPADKYDLAVEYELRDLHRIKDPSISVNAQYVNRQRRVPPDSDYAPPPQAYFLLGINVAAAVTVGKRDLEFGITITNLLNESYRDYMNRFRYYTDDLGRNISFRLKIPFGYEKK